MEWKIDFECKAQEDMAWLKKHDGALFKKLLKLMSEIKVNPRFGTGKPERLRYWSEKDVWSRRIDQKHRLVYEIFEEENNVIIISCVGHYQ